MDIVELALIVPLIFLCVTLWYGYRHIQDTVARRMFLIMQILFFIPYVIFVHDEVEQEWFHHLPFYAGELLYYLFLKRIIVKYGGVEKPLSGGSLTSTAAASGMVLASDHASSLSDHWFIFMTDEGLQHVLTVPFMLLVVSGIRSYFNVIRSDEVKKIIKVLLLASIPLMTIHGLEFFVESQKWFSFLEGDAIEILEYVWNVFSMMIFIWGIGKLYAYTHALSETSIIAEKKGSEASPGEPHL